MAQAGGATAGGTKVREYPVGERGLQVHFNVGMVGAEPALLATFDGRRQDYGNARRKVNHVDRVEVALNVLDRCGQLMGVQLIDNLRLNLRVRARARRRGAGGSWT